MIGPAIGTIATRTVVTVLNLFVVMAAAQFLGTEGVGAISLIVLGITFTLLLNNVIGGSGLVYLTPRHGSNALRWPAYGWALLTAAVAWGVLHTWSLVPEGYATHVVALTFLQSLCGIHNHLLLGRERIGVQNLLVVGQALLLLVAFVLLLRTGDATLMDYVHAAYLAHGLTALIGALVSWEHEALAPRSVRPDGHPLIALLRQGTLSQAANGLQLLNYRLAYFLIERFHGTAALGVYSITTQLAESAWLAPKSLGMVLYARVSNLEAMEEQRDTTLAVLKMAVAIAVVTVLVLVLVPDSLYQFAFGPEVHDLAPLLLLLAPGLIAMSASQALSHFLSGSGRVYHNTISSGLGLLVTLSLGYALIPTMGLLGAAITASAAYSVAVIYQVIIFDRLTHAKWRNYVPDGTDITRLRTVWLRLMGR